MTCSRIIRYDNTFVAWLDTGARDAQTHTHLPVFRTQEAKLVASLPVNGVHISCDTVLIRSALNSPFESIPNKISKMSKLLELSNPVFSSYVLWSSILVLKMLAMSLLTAVQRFKNQVSTMGGLYIIIDEKFILEISQREKGGAIFAIVASAHLSAVSSSDLFHVQWQIGVVHECALLCCCVL